MNSVHRPNYLATDLIIQIYVVLSMLIQKGHFVESAKYCGGFKVKVEKK